MEERRASILRSAWAHAGQGIRWLLKAARRGGRDTYQTRLGIGQLMELVHVARWSTWDSKAQDAACLDLVRVLAEMPRDDLSAMDADDRMVLRMLLIETDKPDLAIELMATFERFGDAAAAPFVEQVACGKAPTSGDPRVREAAAACLGALERAVRSQTEANTLLRPAEPDSAATLLRPASGGPQTPVAHLLRPATTDAADTETLPRSTASDKQG